MGSDWSVSTPDPLLEMEIAVTRVSDESRGEREPFLPHERLELVDALTAFTAGSAYANHLDETGTLAVGKLADLAIIDRDLFDEAAGPIGEAYGPRHVRRRRRRARGARPRLRGDGRRTRRRSDDVGTSRSRVHLLRAPVR